MVEAVGGVGANPSEGMNITKDVVDANRGGLPKRAYFGLPRTFVSSNFDLQIPCCSNKHASNQSAGRKLGGFGSK